MKQEQIEKDLKFYKEKSISNNRFLYHIKNKLKEKYLEKYNESFSSNDSLMKQIEKLIDKL
jgi:hypothetical protein